MARYTRIVLLAGLPAVGPLAFAASVHIAAAPKQMLLGTDESYTLSLTNDGVTIDAATQFGAMRALESFSQLVRWTTAVSDGHSTQRYTVPVPLKIVDAPRFTWRGLLIDSSRHFLPVPTILQTLDAMSYAKLNTLHWHVLDDCAWPIISNAFPNFTAAGAYAPDREQQIGGSGGSLEPPGPLLEPLGLFLRTSITFIWCILSAFLRA
jgi:N-acetyl-beta-hexosaminidase